MPSGKQGLTFRGPSGTRAFCENGMTWWDKSWNKLWDKSFINRPFIFRKESFWKPQHIEGCKQDTIFYQSIKSLHFELIFEFSCTSNVYADVRPPLMRVAVMTPAIPFLQHIARRYRYPLVFNLGLPKSGTSSLQKFMEQAYARHASEEEPPSSEPGEELTYMRIDDEPTRKNSHRICGCGAPNCSGYI